MTFGIQGSLWPVHLKPFGDEILSSWLSRIADGHGLSLNQFLSLSLPRPVGVGFDIDLSTDPEFFKAIIAGTGADHDEAIQTTFIPDQGTIYLGTDPLHLEWIVPLRLQNRRQPGLPFCPTCLATDPVPYYRKQWRYGFFPVCPKHGLLEFQCPNCGHPYAYQGSDSGRDVAVGSGLPGYCRGCRQEFSATSQATGGVVAIVGDLQRRILAGVDDGWLEVPNRDKVHVHCYLRGLHHLASIFHRQEVGCRAAAWIENKAGVTLPWDSAKPSAALERQTPRMRTSALFLADWLIQDWPTRMVDMMENLDLTPATLLPPVAERPHWLSDPDIEGLARGAIALSEAEIEAAQAMLRKRVQWAVSRSQTVDFMQTLQLPEIKPLWASPTIEAKHSCVEAADQITAEYEWKRRLRRKWKVPEPTLYPTIHPKYGVQQSEQDIAEASEDLDGLWIAMRRHRITAPDS